MSKLPSGEVLSFAAVGCHGREWWTPAFALAGFGAAGRFASSALILLLAAATARSQPAATQDLATEFAGRVAAAITPGATVRLVCTGEDGRTQLELGRSLVARGIRLSESTDGATTVRCSCLENLREHACIADIGDGAARRVVAATRPKNAGPSFLNPIVALELRPLHAQRDPILDVMSVSSALLVLSPTTLTRMSIAPQAPAALQSAPITTSRVWPRDLRGRLRTTADGLEVFLPGVTCRGSSTPFTLACADEGESWPIGIENAGVAASRNTFATPEGFSFYEAASLDGGRWVVVDQPGTLTFLDAERRVVARGDPADHVAALRSACAPGSYVVTARRSPDGDSADVLRLARVVGNTLLTEGSTIALPGVVTALWPAPALSPAPDHREANAVVHDTQTGRYEAFHLSLSCAR